uniref:SSO3044-like protein n=1 Tax=Saccharolobus solfataricus (strain 98/2) TaxID=555311 RepID=G8GCV9_SACS9|nr:SSO3044-like protein [Saccharolobus solfataricus 98/2]
MVGFNNPTIIQAITVLPPPLPPTIPTISFFLIFIFTSHIPGLCSFPKTPFLTMKSLYTCISSMSLSLISFLHLISPFRIPNALIKSKLIIRYDLRWDFLTCARNKGTS